MTDDRPGGDGPTQPLPVAPDIPEDTAAAAPADIPTEPMFAPHVPIANAAVTATPASP
ncbi:MAG: hypothetical protein ABIQ01_06225 [Pseudolysinimonas sp.]